MPLSNTPQKRNEGPADIVITRADWRFLLPNPDPENTLCMADGTPAETAQLFSAITSYSGSDPGHSDFDLAILQNPDDDELRYAVSVLRPGAACYVEWDVNVLFTPGRITKKLTDTGFDTVDQYMPKPDPDTAPPGTWSLKRISSKAASWKSRCYYLTKRAAPDPRSSER